MAAFQEEEDILEGHRVQASQVVDGGVAVKSLEDDNPKGGERVEEAFSSGQAGRAEHLRDGVGFKEVGQVLLNLFKDAREPGKRDSLHGGRGL
jgi:hypothetical protein